MPNPNALYEEMMWDPEDELEFKADYSKNQIVIRVKEE